MTGVLGYVHKNTHVYCAFTENTYKNKHMQHSLLLKECLQISLAAASPQQESCQLEKKPPNDYIKSFKKEIQNRL